MYCGQETLVKRDGDAFDAKVLRCRSWKCPDCRDGRRKRLIAEGIGGNPVTFITLTLRADDPRERPDQVKALSRAWRIIRARMLRKGKVKRIPFLAVVEKTKRGTPHLHILTRVRWIDQAWLSVVAAEILDAPIVDVRRIDAHHGIASYVAKYVGKDPEQFGTCKRYWKSPDYDQRPPRERSAARDGWTFADRWRHPILKIVRDLERLGYVAHWSGKDACRLVLDWAAVSPLPHVFRGCPP